MKTVTLTLTITEAEDLDYALLLARSECAKRDWKERSFKIDMIEERLSWRITEAIELQGDEKLVRTK